MLLLVAALALAPVAETGSVLGGADDCAIWVNEGDLGKSLVIGNDKKNRGALYLWNLAGEGVGKSPPLRQPVNPDVRQGVELDEGMIDLVGCGLRKSGKIKLFAIEEGKLRDLVPYGLRSGISRDLYGFTFYHRPRDGALFAFVSQKRKGADIRQVRIKPNLKVELIRRFGGGDQKSYVEGMVVDDERGLLYCADERGGILKYHADPEKGNNLLARFAVEDGITKDREGLAIYRGDPGYLVLSNQRESSLNVYQLEAPHNLVAIIDTQGSSQTYGIAITSRPLPGYPHGLLVCHNDAGTNFVLYDWPESLAVGGEAGVEGHSAIDND